ncbi:DNA/RNA nuclease SfsA [Diplocloster modestus]|uniref:DNA/RNA nuclease SfsA n=1 Tax=Diplocloster modestus TaxID=2850322 RepID=UPI00130E0535|nr:DNA/RNA nuclease SfsA [Diplocloster modestus]
MKYERMEPARFLERPNRFVAYVQTHAGREICHVKNTGRCAELLIPGADILVQRSDNIKRKTALDLIGVYKGERLINMDSQAPNQVAEEWIREGGLFPGASFVRREMKYRSSRFDLYIEEMGRKIFLEVKGVTLERGGIAMFPDAPTERGIKHLNELCGCIREGYEAYVLFVIQMKGVACFIPNMATAPEFGQALVRAQKAGVRLMARDCVVTVDTLKIRDEVEIQLPPDL